MYYGKINNCDTANGIGVRVSLFVSGCRNQCKGCHNPEAWHFGYGEPYTEETEKQILDYLEPYWIEGLSILGGEPLEPESLPEVLKLCEAVRDRFGNQKTIWLYSGYTLEEIEADSRAEILNKIDILVDGRYEEDKKDISLPFRGSSNQRIIEYPFF